MDELLPRKYTLKTSTACMEQVVQQYKKAGSVKETASIYGVSAGKIYNVLDRARKAGIWQHTIMSYKSGLRAEKEARKKAAASCPGYSRARTEARRSEVRSMYERLGTMQAVADELGLTRQRVHQILHNNKSRA